MTYCKYRKHIAFKEPYIQMLRHSRSKSLSFWLVDGNWVRANLDRAFIHVGTSSEFSCIPDGEVWIDEECLI